MERQKTLIVDASVAVKWFIHEENSEKAIKFREDSLSGKFNLIVPELLFLEVINTLRYKKINAEKILYTNKSLWESQFKIHNIDDFLMEKIIDISIKNDISVYDAVYVAISQLYGVPLVTADKKLYKIPNVIALEKI